MRAAPRRDMLTVLGITLLVGCGDSRPSSVPVPVAASPQPVTAASAPAAADAHKYDAYGPWQYSVFNGVNRDNIYRAATGPTTGPVDDSVLLPADDDEW